jgi:hypothetical protein
MSLAPSGDQYASACVPSVVSCRRLRRRGSVLPAGAGAGGCWEQARTSTNEGSRAFMGENITDGATEFLK